MSKQLFKPQKTNIVFKHPVGFGVVNAIDQLFQQGLALLNQGKLEQAGQLFEKITQLSPKNPDAYHLSGIVKAQLKDFEQADKYFEKAIQYNASNAAYYCNRGNVLKELNQYENAITNYDKAIRLKKDYYLAYLNKSIALSEIFNFEEALINIDQAIFINPNNPTDYFKRGNILSELKLFKEAVASYDKALRIKNDYAEAYFNSGNALYKLSKLQEAIVKFNSAITIKKEYAEAYSNKSLAQVELFLYEDGLESSQAAIAINPNLAAAYINCGLAMSGLNLHEEAIKNYQIAISLKNDNAEAHFNCGIELYILNRMEEAIVSYDKAISIKPDYSDAYWNKSFVLLSLNDFTNGWQLYDWRWKIKSLCNKEFFSDKPKLTGIPNNEELKIFIWEEQGVGDQIMYAGLLDQLIKIAPLSQIRVNNKILPLLKRSFPQCIFIETSASIEKIEYDLHMPIGDLGKLFRNDNNDFDMSRNHYLISDSSRASEIRHSLLNGKKYLCGITWSSNAEKTGAKKSIKLDDLLPLLRIEDIAFVSLQYGNIQSELDEFNEKNRINIQECQKVDNFNDLDGHAALIEACDFVVLISNTTAHIAGAIGKETYLICPSGKGAMWYWSNQINGKSMWYPSIQIYKQEIPGEWSQPIQMICNKIKNKINDKT